MLESDRAFECVAMLVTKRLSIGREFGTTDAWHEPVARIVAKIWRTQACRSVLIMEGKTSEASTRADKAVCRRATASSLSPERAEAGLLAW